MAANKFSTERVSAAIAHATDTVGINQFKKVQEQAIRSFMNRKPVCCPCGNPTASLFVTRCCCWYLTSSEETHTVQFFL